MALFEPGQSGNPSGRPRGSRNKVTVTVDKLFEADAEAIVRKAIEMAKGGDPALIRLCLSRLSPPRKDRPIPFVLPPMNSSVSALTAVATITDAVAAGRLTPGEAAHLSQLVANYAKALQAFVVDERLAELAENNSR